MSDESTTVGTESEEREPEELDAGSTRTSATDLGDVTVHRLPEGLQRLVQTVGFEGDAVDYYRFELTESREVRMALQARSGEVELYLEDAVGEVLSRSMAFASYELVVRTLPAGTYYLRVLPAGTGGSEYEFKYGVFPADDARRPWDPEPSLAERLGMPSFEESEYGFALAEHADGSLERVSLGVVSATDTNGDALHYRLVGGNESGRFAIDAETGELFYTGPGEDYEGGAGPHELTVRAGDGTHTVDATVTVTVTDVPEAPAFTQASYAFALAENVDGSEARVSLGVVSATDPDGDALHYALVGGNESGRFAIDAETGELFYAGPGEDYETGAGPHELTVRVSDGTHTDEATQTVDATVTVTVTDVPEAPAFTQASYAFALAENVDGSEAQVSLGTVSATDPDGDALRYTVAGGNESGRFAIDEASGELSYVGAGEDYESGAGPFELTVRASDGQLTAETAVTVTVTDVGNDSEPADGDLPADRTTSAVVRVDEGPVRGRIESTQDVDWFAVDLVGGRTYQFDQRGHSSGDGTLIDPFLLGLFDSVGGYIEGTTAPDGGVRYDSRLEFTAARDGRYYIAAAGNGFEESGTGTYELEVRTVPAPVFVASSYAFALAENLDGSEVRVPLGTVSATDPDGDTLRYRLVGGNESGLFAMDASSGELSYVGAGEDHESGAGPHELTVRASDGTHTDEATVTVTVTDVAEAPAFAASSYAFDLAENADGSATRVPLGTVTATDPDGDTVRYRLVGGNESGLFAMDASSGELAYVGAGEDYESGAGPYALTVRASDATHSVDTTVTVTVAEVRTEAEKAADPRGTSEPAGGDLPAARSTSGEVLVDAEPVEGTLGSPSDRDWFAVTLAPGRTYAFNIEGDTPSGGTAPAIRGLRDSNGNAVPGIAGGPEVRYTTDADASEAVYYVEVGGPDTPAQGASAARRLGTLSISIVPRSSNDDGVGSSYRLRANDVTNARDVADDYPADTTTSGTVAVGGTATTGEIERPGDRDWFAATLDAGKTYRFDLEGGQTGHGTLWDPFLRGIYDKSGALISDTTDDDGGRFSNSQVFFTAPESATYYVAAGAYGSRRGTYSLSVTETTVVPDDYTAGTDTAGRVSPGGSSAGDIERSGDRDWFAVTLEADKTYRFAVSGGAGQKDILPSPFLHGIYDKDGTLIPGTSDDRGDAAHNDWLNAFLRVAVASRVTFTAPEDGTYYASVGATGDQTGTYSISVTYLTDASDDFPHWTNTTGRVVVGDTATGKINYAEDRDWFAVNLEAKSYRFDLEGSRSNAGTLSNPFLRGIHDADGNLIPGTQDGDDGYYESSYNSRVFFEPRVAGTYHVSAGTYRSIFADRRDTNLSGTYRLSVTEVTDDFRAWTDTTGRVAVEGIARGEIEFPDDRDWFAVTLKADTTYQFDLKGVVNRYESLWDTRLLGIHDANGILIPGTTGDYTGRTQTARVVFTAPEEATYYVSAGAAHGEQGRYRLFLKDVTDDFAGDTSTTGRLPVGGGVAGEIETEGDRDWFAVDLEAGKLYLIDVTQTGYRLWLYDATGSWTGVRETIRGTQRLIVFQAPEDATYYVSVQSWFPPTVVGRDLTYWLRAKEVADDFTAATDTTGMVEVDGSEEGKIEYPWDQDWFAVNLEAGKVYLIDLLGSGGGPGALKRPHQPGIYDTDGNRINSPTGDDTRDDPFSSHYRVTYAYDDRLFFTAPEDATYYVSARSQDAYGGTYTLRVWAMDTGEVDDFTAATDTTGTVEVGESVTGVIEVGRDRDWFEITLAAGTTYQIDLEGWSTRAGTLYQPVLGGIYDASGGWIDGTKSYGGGVGRNSRVTFTPGADDTYYIEADGYSHDRGTYTLSVEEVTDAM